MGFSGKGILELEIVAIVGGLGGRARIVRRSRMLMLFDLARSSKDLSRRLLTTCLNSV